MKLFSIRLERALTATVSAWLACATAFSQNAPISLRVDATGAPRKILRARLTIPARPGKMTLVYPKWIPGEHGPNGPVTDLAGLRMSAGGKPLEWRRDPDDMYAFDLTTPAGTDAVEVALDFLLPPDSGAFSSGASSTSDLLDLSWNQVILYPKGSRPADLQVAATLRLPEGWRFGTALPVAGPSADGTEFAPVSLETLVDSAVVAGAHFRTVDLTPGASPSHEIHIVADSEAALEMKPGDLRHFSHLVAETGALFGARHYRGYHFLLTLSDHVAHFGLEHHESSDDRAPEDFLTDEEARNRGATLLPHEMVHSWNGKYRRPAGLATPDFEKPMRGELLWVYEGLTDYLGIVLTARSGLWTNEVFRENLALEAANLDHTGGRSWRPLADTADAAQLLYLSRSEGEAWRRGVDFYAEGDLIWLEADVLIRQQSHGRRSLNDFCRKFHGGPSGAPQVLPYALDDVLAALNETAPYDWRGFFHERVYAINLRAPLGGIEGAGWRLAYTDKLPDLLKSREGAGKFTDLGYSLGFSVKEGGEIIDTRPGSPADQAGLGPAMKLVAVNGRRWTPALLRAAVKSAKTAPGPIELLVENDDYYKTLSIDYHEGEKYPVLERVKGKPDVLAEILKPLTPETPAAPKK